jgi:ribosomal protein S21
MTIKVRNNNLEAALRVFKRVYSERVFEYKNRQEYEKPSISKRKSKLAAKARERKRQDGNKLRTRR